MSRPSKTMRPAVVRTMPKTVFSRVDLPAPLAPMMETMSPAWTRTETPRSTSTSSYPARTSLSSRSGAPSPCSMAKVGLDDLRVSTDRRRRALGDLLAVVQHHDALGDVHHDLHVVLDEEDGLAPPVQSTDVLHHLPDHGGVHGGGGLVEQEQIGVGHERRREGEQLALAVREVSRGHGRVGGEADQLQERARPVGGLRLEPAQPGRAEEPGEEVLFLVLLEEDEQVLEHGEPREDAHELERPADP